MQSPRTLAVVLTCSLFAFTAAGQGVQPGNGHSRGSAKASSSGAKLVVNPSRDQIIPIVYDGNGWTTLFMITNLDNHTIVVDVEFSAKDGSNLLLPVSGIGNTTGVEVTVPQNGNYSFVTSGFAQQRTTGYAYVSSKNGSDLFGGYAIARNQVRNLPDLELTVPFTPIDENFFTLAFDNLGGYSTSAILINSSATNQANVFVTVEDSEGNVLVTDTILIDPYGRFAFNLADFYPVVNQLIGNVYFSATGTQFVAGAGLRVGPNQSTTVIPTLSLAR